MMSQPPRWPLSQDANKLSGTCSVCYSTRQLHLRDGTVHLHGPRSQPCPGSKKLPIGLCNPPTTHASSTLGAIPTSDVKPTSLDIVLGPVVASSQGAHTGLSPTVLQPVASIIKHIPRSARAHCANELISAISKILTTPESVDAWTIFLNFSSTILTAPRRTGRKHNITTVLRKRSVTDVIVPVSHDISAKANKSSANDEALATAVMSKIEDGNFKAAIRILGSDDRLAPDCSETVDALRERHPSASQDRMSIPDQHNFSSCTVSEADVAAAIRSFPAGSAGGPDRFRPQHLRDLSSNLEKGPALLSAVTGLVNLLLDGKCPQSVASVLFGGNLTALTKKTGGIRPIAVGYTWRRLAAKCAMKYALVTLDGCLLPRQLGVGVSGGCEAAVHATRRFIADMPEDYVVAKLDFSNAFNCVRRDVMLKAVADQLPQLYRFCYLAYNQPSVLRFGRHVISSEEGAQQGDPLGPLLFCLAIQPLLQSMRSPLSFAYIDDVTAGGPSQVVAADIERISKTGPSFGLELNIAKCEIISTHKPTGKSILAQFQHYTPDTASLLGAPLDKGQAMDERLSARCNVLARVISRLELISAHDALVLLKNSFSAPRVQFTLRSAPCVGHPHLQSFDNLLRTAASKICNVTLSDDQWQQASLPVRYGGLGIRRVSSLAPSAFLASAAGTRELQRRILDRSTTPADDPTFEVVMQQWRTLSNSEAPTDFRQRAMDNTVVVKEFDDLLSCQTDNFHRARLLAAASEHSGDWLHALPISACGLRLDNEAIRVATGLRLGCSLCESHQCPCGATTDVRGVHGLSCRRSAGRQSRHHYLNDLIWRALTRAGIPATKEPNGLARTDGKRPDGLTLVPWREGKTVTWDVTVAYTVAGSYLPITSNTAGAAAAAAAERKTAKYTELLRHHLFVPIAIETFGPICEEGQHFIREIGKRISSVTSDPRETAFLFQRLSIAIQRFNAVCFSGTFPILDS